MRMTAHSAQFIIYCFIRITILEILWNARPRIQFRYVPESAGGLGPFKDYELQCVSGASVATLATQLQDRPHTHTHKQRNDVWR